MTHFNGHDDFISFGDEINSESHVQDNFGEQNLVEDQYDHRGTDRRRAFEQLQRQGGYLNYKQSQHAASRIRPWTLAVDWEACRNPSEMLHREILAYVDYISPSEREHRTRAMIVKMITATIESRWPDALVQPFGSFETGLYLPLGDIDLVVSSENISRNPNALGWIARTLKDRGLANNIQIIAKAKVPIIKFVTTWGGFKVDISLNQVNGVTAGKIINNFLARLPALRPLVLIFKAFLSQRDMNEVYNGGLGSYSVVSNDVSRGSYNMNRIRTTLSGGHSALTTIMFERNDQLNAKRQSRYVKLQKPDPVLDADAMSILGSILNVSQETINHRRMVAELYDSGALHEAAGVPFEPVSTTEHESPPQPDPKHSPSLLARLGPSNQPSPNRNGRQSSKRQRERSPSLREFAVDSDDSAWHAADRGARLAAGDSDGDDEDGRYGVESVRKRARKGRPEDVVWISDDSDEDHAPKGGISIAGASKRAQINGQKDTNGQDKKRERVDKRREYWRSKGTSRKDLSVSERIAALKRGSSPQPQGGARHTSPPGTPPTLASSHSLKDKIAHFDALGSAPKPVGSFGLGGSLVPDHRNVNRELYGNRIPSVSHKIGRSVSGGKDVLQAASSSTSSLDHDVLTHSNPGSTHSGEASEENPVASSPTGSRQESLSVREGTSAAVPEIRRTDSMTERWVDTLQSKPTISLDTSGPAGVFAPPSPVPDSEDARAPSGPITPLTTTLISHLGASSRFPSRL
ncbi:hypothetical protein FRC06_005081, partial [Ceratobasidium sp. 370]